MLERKVKTRYVKNNDLDKIRNFFVSCYSKKTVFQNKDFLFWYFSSRDNDKSIMKKCIISESDDGQIVSFYGGLERYLRFGNRLIPFVWGVNAYTLPEWRGKGLNSGIVKQLKENNTINGVIGMNSKAAQFYDSVGYNMFNMHTFDRYVLVLNKKTFDIIRNIGQNVNLAKDLLYVYNQNVLAKVSNIVKLKQAVIDKNDLELDVNIVLSIDRNMSYLKHRFINNEFINYRIFACVRGNKILGYIASREEILHPYKQKAYRIIDIYGNEMQIFSLLQYIIYDAKKRGNLYIDFSMFGILYRDVMQESGFSILKGKNVCLLPQVTSPVENRPNHEFIGLQSIKFNDDIMTLNQDDVYFTRADSDRDRLNSVSQLSS